MKKYWFKPKKYGYGFFPISWEGYLSIFVFILFLFISAYVNNIFGTEAGLKEGLGFILDVFIIASIFTVLFKHRVEGGLRWQWGEKKGK